MLAACRAALPADAAIFAAAVADWRVAQPAAHKLKKRQGEAAPALDFVLNPDILATLSAPGPDRPRLTIGFAAETDDVPANAAAKRERKQCDWILANDVRPETGIMGGTHNRITLFDAAGREDWPDLPKDEVAARIAARVASALTAVGADPTA
jgi:phosphopantothenoylcysteine decarboxylase/phosphopantothenate--cysteine ligase